MNSWKTIEKIKPNKMPGAVNENNEIFINAPNPCVDFFIMPKVLWVEECFGKSSLIERDFKKFDEGD